MKRLKRVVLAILLLEVTTAAQADPPPPYHVEFDCFSETPSATCKTTYSLYADLGDEIFTLREWGSGDPQSTTPDREGSRILNATPSGSVIRAIYIKIGNPATGDRFAVDVASAGHLFSEVWRKNDGTEVIFNGAKSKDLSASPPGIQPNEYFWMRVLPHTMNNPSPTNLFGRASQTDIPIPTDGTWQKVFPVGTGTHSAVAARSIDREVGWPALSHEVRTYCESPSKRTVLLISNDHLLLFDRAKKDTRLVQSIRALPRGINRITADREAEAEVFVLWKNGGAIARMQVNDMKLGPPISGGKF